MEQQHYWKRVCALQEKQTNKGIEKYGQILEDNKVLTPLERVTYLEEELIDGLMYCEHLKQLIQDNGEAVDDVYANAYQRKALRTMSPETEADPLLNGALGLAGESGEFCDLIKKNRFQRHPLDKEHLAKELGDICWYLATSAYGLGLPLSEIMDRNIQKLKERYPEGFDEQRSLNREEADK